MSSSAHVNTILKLILLITLIIITLCAFVVRPGNSPPKEYLWKTWAELLMKPHLVNMTAELIKDVENKLKHAEKIKDKHANSVTFELGFIAAGIQERFHLMLSLYRKYADLEQFRKETHSVMDLLKAYQIMQGYYNEIRLEKSIFHDIVRKYESTTAGTMPWDIKRNPSKLNAASNPGAPSGPKPQQQLRRQGKWRRPLLN